MTLDHLPPLREVIRAHGLSAQKRLGQNFLLDLNLTDKIARAAGPLDGVTVIEVGPGPGGLTRSLLGASAAHVVAIERDARCIAILNDIAAHAPGRLTVIEADALATDLSQYACGPTRIVANLPYNIATPLLVDWLSSDAWPPFFDRLVLMFQLEVAERITAAVGTKAYGRLGILAQWRTVPRILFKVPPSAFIPAPLVTSAMVELVPRMTPYSCRREALERLTAAAFGQRRKMLRSSLKGLGSAAIDALTRLDIDTSRRAETLSVEEFCSLARAMDA